MFFYPWCPALMLAVESNNVIDIRLRHCFRQGQRQRGNQLNAQEKVDAAFEAGLMLVSGRKPADVIDFYRKHVAAKAARLS